MTKGTAIGQMADDLGSSVALTRAAGENSSADQADLLMASDFEAELGLFAENSVAPPAKRGAGRPPGSPNRSTLQLQKLLMARGYRDPAEFLAALITMDPRDLAAKLAGWKDAKDVKFPEALEALKVQRAAAGELLPYFHQKMPQQVEVKGDGPRALIVVMDGPQGGRAMGALGPETLSIHEPIQHVSADDPRWSHVAGSQDEG